MSSSNEGFKHNLHNLENIIGVKFQINVGIFFFDVKNELGNKIYLFNRNFSLM